MKKKKSWLVGDDVPRPHSGKVTVTSRHEPPRSRFLCSAAVYVCLSAAADPWSLLPSACIFVWFVFIKTFQMKKGRHAGKNTVNYLSSKMESWLQFHPVYKCQTSCLERLLDVLVFFVVFFLRRANVKIYITYTTTTHWVVASLGCIPPPFSSIYVQY